MTSGPPESAQTPDPGDGAGYDAPPPSGHSQQAQEMMSGGRLKGEAISHKEFISAVQEVGALEAARETRCSGTEIR
jgi:hypothetical protein